MDESQSQKSTRCGDVSIYHIILFYCRRPLLVLDVLKQRPWQLNLLSSLYESQKSFV
jgi:hypothetical protein